LTPRIDLETQARVVASERCQLRFAERGPCFLHRGFDRIGFERLTLTDAPETLVFDLVEWVAKQPRTYAEMLDAWRTSCPRLTVWEDAIERGLVMRQPVAGQGTMVVVTESGRRFLGGHERETVSLASASSAARHSRA
jgi:hypothetical protein